MLFCDLPTSEHLMCVSDCAEGKRLLEAATRRLLRPRLVMPFWNTSNIAPVCNPDGRQMTAVVSLDLP